MNLANQGSVVGGMAEVDALYWIVNLWRDEKSGLRTHTENPGCVVHAMVEKAGDSYKVAKTLSTQWQVHDASSKNLGLRYPSHGAGEQRRFGRLNV